MTDRYRPRTEGSSLLIVAGALMGLLAGLLVPPAQAAIGARTVPPGYLAVSPGTIGPLRMGATVAKAKRLGLIRRGPVCGDIRGWLPGTTRVDRDRYWVEYFPDAVSGGRVRSYWIKGDDFRTTKGLRPGATVAQARRAYPTLLARGRAFDDASGYRFRVYSVGSGKRGYLDLYFIARGDSYRPGPLAFAYVRTSAVPVKRRFADGC